MTLPLASSSTQTDQPPRTQLLTNLTTQTALLTRLFLSLSTPNPTTSSNPITSSQPGSSLPQDPLSPVQTLYAALESQTTSLTQDIEALWTHQLAWRALKKQEAEVRDLEGRVRGLIWELESGRAELEGLVFSGREVRAGIDRGEKDPLSVRTILSHAHNLANYTSAPNAHANALPSSSGPGNPTHEQDPTSSSAATIRKQTNPYPPESSMREGILYLQGGTMADVGDTLPAEYGHVAPADSHAPGGISEGYGVGVGDGHGHDDWVEAPARGGGGEVFDLDLNSDSDDD